MDEPAAGTRKAPGAAASATTATRAPAARTRPQPAVVTDATKASGPSSKTASRPAAKPRPPEGKPRAPEGKPAVQPAHSPPPAPASKPRPAAAGSTTRPAAGAAPDRYRAPALDKGLDILEVLADQARGLTRSEIVKALGVSPSQIYRMLERLVARGYVTRIEGGDRYALTMRLFLLATRHPPIRRLVARAQPLMDNFSRDMVQPCHLVVPEQGSGIIVAHASPTGHWEFRARIGGQIDLFGSGSGLTLLAFQHPDRVLETLGTWGVADAQRRLAAVAAELAEVRRQGWRVAPSNHHVGVTDLSAPVFGPGGEAIGVVTCAYIEHPDDCGRDSHARALAALVAIAAELSHSDPG